jgi:hypothetical protein
MTVPSSPTSALRQVLGDCALAVRARLLPSLCALLLTAAGGVFLWFGMPLWWIGASCLVGSALTLWHAYRQPLAQAHAFLSRPRNWLGMRVQPSLLLLDLFYIGLIVWVASVMMYDVLDGGRPVSHDHTVHYVKAWQLHTQFLPRGRLHGWSHRWFAGYPVDYLYPIGTDLFVNVVHFLSFGALRFSSAYGVAFWLFHVLTGYSGYRFGRVVGGPHVGLITGILMITDMSAFRFGGWAYSIEYGVWPQALSLTFALLAVARLPALYEERKLRHLGIFGLWMGAAIVTHPIELIYLGVMLLVAPLAGMFCAHVKTAAGTFRLLVAYVLATLISAAWLLPFLDTKNQTTSMGVWWDSTYEMGKGLLNLTAFPGTLGFVLVLGSLAAVVMLRSRRFVWMFTALMALLIPAISSSTFIDELHLTRIFRSFSNIQWLRMSTMAKPFWFAMTGYFVVAFLRRSRELVLAVQAPRPPGGSYLRDVLLGMLIAFLTLPIVVPACQAFWTANVVKTVNTESDRALDPNRAALVSWLKTKLPRDGFYRVCVNTGHNHDLMDIAAELPMPIFKRGFTPAENFIYKVNVENPEIMEAVNVRYMIAKKPMPAEDYEEVTHFGIYRVYRFKRWHPQPFVVTQGQGEVKVERFGDDEIRLRAAAGSHGKLRLNVSYFPRWHAYRDGKPIALWTSSLPAAASMTGFMTVHLLPGEYRFAFEPSRLDRISLPLSLLGILLALGFVIVDRFSGGLSLLVRVMEGARERLEALSSERFARLRVVLLVVVAFGLLGTLTVLAQRRFPLVLENLNGAVIRRVRFDFLEDLSTAMVNIEYAQQNRRCLRVSDRFVCRNADGDLDNEKYVGSTPAEIEEYRMVRCIRARPEDDALLTIYYPTVPSGDAIVGYYGVERAGRLMRLTRPVDFKVSVDGKPTYQGATVSDNKMHWFEAKVGGRRRNVNVMFTVSARNISKRFFCFYAQMAELEQAQTPAGKHGAGATSVDEDDEQP